MFSVLESSGVFGVLSTALEKIIPVFAQFINGANVVPIFPIQSLRTRSRSRHGTGRSCASSFFQAIIRRGKSNWYWCGGVYGQWL